MLKTFRIVPAAALITAAVLIGGCYTQISKPGIEQRYPHTRVVADDARDAGGTEYYEPVEQGYDSGGYTEEPEYYPDDRSYENNRYSTGLDTDYIYDDVAGDETAYDDHIGYTHTETFDTDGGTVINHYYYDSNPWYPAYSYWYDPWDPWDTWWYTGYHRPYWNSGWHMSVGFGWYDPWYDPWDFYIWDPWYYPRYTYWGHHHYPYYNSYWYGYNDGYWNGHYWYHDSPGPDGNRRQDRLAGLNTGVNRSRRSSSVLATDSARQSSSVRPTSTVNGVERATRRNQTIGASAGRSGSAYTAGTSPNTYNRRSATPGDYTPSSNTTRRGQTTTGTTRQDRTTSSGQERSTSLQRSQPTTRRTAPSATTRSTTPTRRPTTRSSTTRSTSQPAQRSSGSSTQRSAPARRSAPATTRSAPRPSTTRSMPTRSTPTRSTPTTRSAPRSAPSSSGSSSRSSGSSSRSGGSSGSSRSSGGSSGGRRR